MTRKEAIDIISKATVYNDEERKALSILVPELNENEWIRKALIKKFEEHLERGYEWEGIPVRRVLDWINNAEFKKDIAEHISGSGAIDDTFEACMLRYLQDAANRSSDEEIIKDTKEYKKQLLSFAEEVLRDKLLADREMNMELQNQQWYPEEWHLQGLRKAIWYAPDGSETKAALENLYEQLKAF